MSKTELICLSVFFCISSLVLVLWRFVIGRRAFPKDRLHKLAAGPRPEAAPDSRAGLVQDFLPRLGDGVDLGSEEQRTRLQTRLVQAGYYSRPAVSVFLGVKLLLMLTPWVIGLAVGLVGFLSILQGVAVGAALGSLGNLAPGVWLARRKSRRQVVLRRGLPDIFDILVICVESGMSLPGAFQRVGKELQMANPMLAMELNIVRLEMECGLSLGQALHHFGDRSDLEEVFSLASLVSQTERLGEGVVRTLRIHAESLRQLRMQQVEEMARKAAIKILFPSLLLIFPGIFVILVGPAAFQIMEVLSKLKVP